MSHCVTKQKGSVLIVTLLFMQIGVLLGLYAFEANVIQARIGRYTLQNQVTTNELEGALQETEQSVQEKLPSCMISGITGPNLIKMPLSWWQKQSCSSIFQEIQYYYVLEFLREDPCATILHMKDVTAGYYRLTVYGNNVLLQSTLIRPELAPHHCEGIFHTVAIGRQSWRRIY